jgi:hypothetical protein
MTDQQRTRWIEYLYPLTIVADRYSGAYSGGEYVAFPLDFDEIDPAVNADDVACATFWTEEQTQAVGLGESPEAAFHDLKVKMGKAINDTDKGDS